jgi:hypothetical protein
MSTRNARNLSFASRASAVLVLGASDVLLALSMWGAAFVTSGVLGHWPLSALEMTSILPNVVLWVWIRAALGLYPGDGLDKVQERRRQALALVATAVVIGVFSLAAQLGDSGTGPLLFAWAWGLWVTAPVVRPYVKALLYS